ncbi:type VI secretion system protein ImpC [Vibrio cholerae]|nr:type VI secretion system protein ImpC [Vibrio cholerae]
MDEILHNSQFQAMESAWRGLKLFVDRTDFLIQFNQHLVNQRFVDRLSRVL